MKNKRKTLITVLCVVLVSLGVAGTLFLDETISGRVINVITTCTAIIGAVALFFQFRRDKDLNEASFLVKYSDQFYSTYDCAPLMNELEKSRVNPDYKIDVDKNYQRVVGYLEWLETLAALVNDGLLPIAKIDNVMSYRFFLIVNNKQIQERELIPGREFYRGIYALYPRWEKYKKQRGLMIVLEENALSRTEHFTEIAPPPAEEEA